MQIVCVEIQGFENKKKFHRRMQCLKGQEIWIMFKIRNVQDSKVKTNTTISK